MGYLVVGCFLAALVWGAMQWYANTNVKNVKKLLISFGFAGLFAAGALLIVYVARGNIGFIPLLVVLFPIAKKLRAQGKEQKSERGFRGSPSRNSTMSRTEALEILGLKEGASQQEIKAAYRKLITSVHPDVGGSDWMAAKLNEAKRLLLKE